MQPDSGADLLTTEEAAVFLRRSPRAIRELTAKNAIPHRKMRGCRRVLFPRRELLAWLDGAALIVETAPGSRVVRAAVPS